MAGQPSELTARWSPVENNIIYEYSGATAYGNAFDYTIGTSTTILITNNVKFDYNMYRTGQFPSGTRWFMATGSSCFTAATCSRLMLMQRVAGCEQHHGKPPVHQPGRAATCARDQQPGGRSGSQLDQPQSSRLVHRQGRKSATGDRSLDTWRLPSARSTGVAQVGWRRNRQAADTDRFPSLASVKDWPANAGWG